MITIDRIENSFVQLANQVAMPIFGLGVFKSKEGDEVKNAVQYALQAGYRHIDTAAIYGNEVGVGQAIKNSNVKREDIFITTKLWNTDQGYDSALKAFDKSIKKLDTEYVDLYLIHWAVKDKFNDSWKALEKLYNEKRVRAIGISNFMIPHIEQLKQTAHIMPMVNQIEFHPYLQSQHLVEYCKRSQIAITAWSPIMRGEVDKVPLLQELANKYRKTPAQITLRWNIQQGIITIPKSVNKERIENNAQIFDFEISTEDIERINSIDKNHRIGPDPMNFNF